MRSLLARLAFLIKPLVAVWLILAILALGAIGLTGNILRAGWVGFWLVVAIIRVVVEYQPKARIGLAANQCRTLETSSEEYCLLLRPFGADGIIYVPAEAKGKKGEKHRRDSQMVEQIACEGASALLGVDTWAIVDPKSFVLPAGPRWLSTSDESWKEHVEALIKRALFVVIVLPPGKGKTRSLDWEVMTCITNGLADRMLFIVPPKRMEGAEHSRSALRGFSESFPMFDDLPESVLVILPDGDRSVNYWLEPEAAAGPVSTMTYESALTSAIGMIATRVERSTFAQRYPYRQTQAQAHATHAPRMPASASSPRGEGSTTPNNVISIGQRRRPR